MTAADPSLRRRWFAVGLGVLAIGEVGAAIALTVAVGWSWAEALDAFVVTNGLMGATFGACGAIIGWYRPRNAVGWLFVAAGVAQATAALLPPLLEAVVEDAPIGLLRVAVTLFWWSWPWAIALCIPLALLLFPDGRPPSRGWRPVVVAVAATAPLFVLEWGTGPDPPAEHLPMGYLVLPSYDRLAPLWIAAEVRTLAAFALAAAALVVRYRRAAEPQRRQLLWLLLASLVVVAVVAPWSFVAGTPILVLLAIPLIPVAVAVAIVRHQLLDIRLVLSRAVAWIVLSGGVVVAYMVLVALLDRFVSAQLGRSAVATVVVALLVAPVLPRLQRVVDRAMYGQRQDPARVVSSVAQQLGAGPSDSLPGVAAAIRRALRLPYVAVAGRSGILAVDGAPGTLQQRLPLEYDGAPVGEVVVGLRPGERTLSAPDRDVLGLLTVPLAVAVHALDLSAELQRSRERIVTAREEERRRLRRDLHDGLGPTLTGVAFAADAAANRLNGSAPEVQQLLASIRTDSRAAISDVRRLIDDLRPLVLDELGLVGALRQWSEQMPRRAGGSPVHIVVNAPEDMADLPAAVEVAAYRIATEALTNVLRHATATEALVNIRCGDSLDLEIIDNGASRDAQWQAGVGLHGMRERVHELGGRLAVGPSPRGGRVAISLPLGRA